MPHMEENSVVLLSIVFKLVCGCGSTLWSTVVGGFVPHVFLGWVLNLGNAKNRYSQLVSILARHLKYSVWHWNTRKLTWYSSNILWWIRTILLRIDTCTFHWQKAPYYEELLDITETFWKIIVINHIVWDYCLSYHESYDSTGNTNVSPRIVQGMSATLKYEATGAILLDDYVQ